MDGFSGAFVPPRNYNLASMDYSTHLEFNKDISSAPLFSLFDQATGVHQAIVSQHNFSIVISLWWVIIGPRVEVSAYFDLVNNPGHQFDLHLNL